MRHEVSIFAICFIICSPINLKLSSVNYSIVDIKINVISNTKPFLISTSKVTFNTSMQPPHQKGLLFYFMPTSYDKLLKTSGIEYKKEVF